MSPKLPVSLASLTLEGLSPDSDIGIPWPEFLKLDYKDRVTIVAYLDNMKKPPENFGENTEQYAQFAYTGRKKRDKETLKNAITKAGEKEALHSS